MATEDGNNHLKDFSRDMIFPAVYAKLVGVVLQFKEFTTVFERRNSNFRSTVLSTRFFVTPLGIALLPRAAVW